jgi:4-azaleucine resistance transporter AzlC
VGPADRPPLDPDLLRASRRRLVLDGVGIIGSTAGVGLVYGVSAGAAHFSLLEAVAMSVIVFAGASQFAAVGFVVSGFGWPGTVVLTAFLNARHLLYSAALAPFFADRPRRLRAVIAHVLTDEAFALSIAHFRRIGRADLWGYGYAALVTTFVPWNVATIVGVLVGGAIPDPALLGLDVIFPAAMAGLAVGLVTGRREAAAAIAGVGIGVAVAAAWNPSAGTVAGGVLGPVVGLLVPARPGEAAESADASPVAGSVS